jgi:hypothetical protein
LENVNYVNKHGGLIIDFPLLKEAIITLSDAMAVAQLLLILSAEEGKSCLLETFFLYSVSQQHCLCSVRRYRKLMEEKARNIEK